MMFSNPKFIWGPNLAFFAFGPWAIIHGIGPKLANSVISQIQTLLVPFERSPSKLSENQKIMGSQKQATERVSEPTNCVW